ncbi:protein kinase [Actinomycetes bacterium KLBMP 9797]
MSASSQLVANRYRLVEPLGQGGMGRVWKARDEVLHREVAIKELVPPPGFTPEERQEMRERSLREARAIARLNHINVVRIFDVLRTDGDPWIVMEYVASRSLQDVLAVDGPVSPVRAAEIGLGVLGALRSAHRAGVVHRDVKPGNVLLADDGRVVLTDFGLATVPGDPNVTRTGLVLGSPAYIAPERARDGTAGPEADMWSLGATLFAAVEGQAPYARPSAIGTLAALATEPPPTPRHAGPLKAVLNGLLRKDPRVRIKADEAERLLRRAAGRRTRANRPMLDGVRRPSALGAREPLAEGEAATRVVPTPRLPADLAIPVIPGKTAKIPLPATETPETPEAAKTPEAVEAPTEAPPAEETPAETPNPSETPAAPRPEPALVAEAPTAKPIPAWIARVPSYAKGVNKGPFLAGVAAAVVVILLAVVLFTTLTDDTDPVSQNVNPASSATAVPSPTAAGTPAPSAAATSAAPSASPSASPGSSSGVQLPAGWRMYTDSTGFSVALPGNWSVSRERTMVFFREQTGEQRLLGIDQTDEPKPDPVADWRDQESRRRGDYNDYQRVRIAAVDYWDKAADWEWIYTSDRGNRIHVVNRGFVTAPDKAYAIYWSTSDESWAANQDEFALIAASFKPARS